MQNNSNSIGEILKQWVKETYLKVNNFSKTRTGKLIGRVFGYLVQGGIIVYLVYELTQIGWNNFFKALPATPYFYLLFLILYWALPVTEIFCYKQSWNIGFWESMPTFIKKRVYNKTVMDYSGEISVLGWARKKGGQSEKEIFKVIRDNNIMSSLASSSVVFGLLLFFVLTGKIALLDYYTEQFDRFTIISILIIAVVLVATAYRYREYYFSMAARIAFTVFGFHATRMIIINIVQVLQWYVVMPEVPLNIWFTFLSVQLLVSRIPFLPSRDLISIGASLEISNFVDVSSAGIAGLLIAHSVLYKLMNVVLFTFITFYERRDEGVIEQVS